MSHDTSEIRPQTLTDLDQQPVSRLDSGAVAIAVDLDQRVDLHVFDIAEVANRAGGFDCVEDDAKIAAGADQIADLRQLNWRDSDSVENVSDAVSEEVSRLG